MPKNLYACVVETQEGENRAQNTVLFCEANTLGEAQRQIQERATQQIAAGATATGLMTVFPVEMTGGIGGFSWGLLGGRGTPAGNPPTGQTHAPANPNRSSSQKGSHNKKPQPQQQS